jgi:hypothetical protein
MAAMPVQVQGEESGYKNAASSVKHMWERNM